MTETNRIISTVLEVQRTACFCLIDGREVLASIRLEDESETVTVGDVAEIERVGEDYYVRAIQPRRSCFYRLDPDPNIMKRQPVAANFDYIFLVQALGHDFNIGRLERYLAAAWPSGGTPVVVLTKADTFDDVDNAVLRAAEIAVGAEVHAISAVTGLGMETMERYFAQGKTVALVGSSGVGKSTLVNAVAGKEVMSTGAVREFDQRGRHTTTYRRMILLPNGARVIDTPGMRSLGVVESEGLGSVFPDVEEVLAKGCRFSDCTHSGEPGCSVAEAVREGTLSRERWERYRKLMEETERIERGIARHERFKESKKSRKTAPKRAKLSRNEWEDDE